MESGGDDATKSEGTYDGIVIVGLDFPPLIVTTQQTSP